MRHLGRTIRARLLIGAAAGVLACAGGVAHAQDREPIVIAPQPLESALYAFGGKTGLQVLFAPNLAASKKTAGVAGETDVQLAMTKLLEGTGLTYHRNGDMFVITQDASDPQAGSAVGGGAETNVVQELVVTAQKKSENIQVVPIAISAFTQQDLTTRQVTGGPDLMTQVPNMTFTKTNFSGYSIQIRGIGTQAVSATTDAAVAVAFNNTPFIRNRFFEQEFYDLERVEVLRGPQGTLYGRNATAGVVNIISAKPTFDYQAKASVDVANYSGRRLEGMINVPLVDDKVALRLAGAWTKRDGYDTNQITGDSIDGRDLWSSRVSLRIEPNEKFKANFIWEHFQENDDRLRSGKQLCKEDEVTNVAGFPTTHYQTLPEAGQELLFAGVQGTFSQGCKPESLYSPDSFQTPNGIALPYYLPLKAIFLPAALDDPYVSRFQSRDLRTIESTVDPIYRAKTDLGEIQLSFDLGHDLTLASETGYLADQLFSLEDYNRFNTASGAWIEPDPFYVARPGVLQEGPNGGIFCDPQIGCADRLVAVDLSTAKSRQFSQEFRLSSNFDGKFNFSLGVNYLRYDTEDKYYVFINSLSLIAAISPFGSDLSHDPYIPGVTDNTECLKQGHIAPDPTKIQSVTYCTYMDPNPVGSLDDQGHNYFLSRNPYRLISYAAFGEIYYNLTDTLKITGGLRWTVDRKDAPRIPSWVLADSTAGYPTLEVVRQQWSEPTGRIAIDWRPQLAFTDQTLLYASYAHGYKAGGANPPPTGPDLYCSNCGGSAIGAAAVAASVTQPKTFDPEFVNAFEIGSKNTLLDGRLTVNVDAFFYDYTGYQISQIVNRSAVNLNFDAKIWGAELEADWRPLKNLRLGFKGGYENTRVADGMKAVDLMDRTAGHSDWVVVRPFPTFPSNCILPSWLFVGEFGGAPSLVNLGGKGGGNPAGCELAYLLGHDPVTDAPYTPNPATGGAGSTLFYHPGYAGWDPATAPNHGEGFYKDLSGNELPNAPHFTATITADYTIPLPHDWLATLHTDLYYQSEAWTRIFNTPGYDRLKAYSNINVAAIFTNDAAGWKVMAYVKNVLDRDSITGAFLNSDDTGLTTNVFLTEPRLYGLRVTKDFTGGPWWTGGSGHRAGEPYALTLEIGGQVQRQDAPYQTLAPAFVSAFPAGLDPTAAQHRDLDWGDDREVGLSFRPSGSPWTVAGGVRYGRANGAAQARQQQSGGPKVCAFLPSTPRGRLQCDPTYVLPGYPAGNFYTAAAVAHPLDWAESASSDRESHLIIDFKAARDVGLGRIGQRRSSLAFGLRYANFKSTGAASMDGIPDWNVPQGFFKYNAIHDRYTASINAEREFKGLGPMLSWEAASRLLGNEEVGHLDADWSLGAGVLFGKQKTRIAGSEETGHIEGKYRYAPVNLPPLTKAPLSIAPRSRDATVPVVDLSVGLSYEIQRLKLSTGYRWERYFNAIDAGYAGHGRYDRTLDGPYLKVSVGFGG